MSIHNNQKRHLPIPEEAIEGPAGVSEEFFIQGFQVLSACKDKEGKPSKKNTKTITPVSNKRQGKYDIGLREGMVISAKNGGIAITKQQKEEESFR